MQTASHEPDLSSGSGLLRLIAPTSYVLFCVLTSLYCLLAYIPFTYQQMLKSNLIPQANEFARLHPILQILITLVLLWDLGPELLISLKQRCWQLEEWLIAAVLLVQVSASIFCFLHPVLIGLLSEARSFVVGVAALMPPIGLCTWHLIRKLRLIRRRGIAPGCRPSPARLCVASMMAAISVWLVYALAAIRQAPGLNPGVTFASLGVLILLFSGAFLLFDAALCLLHASRLQERWALGALHCLLFAAVWQLVFRQLCRPFGFDGTQANVYAALLSLTLTSLYALHSLHHILKREGQPASSFEAVLQTCHFGLARSSRSALAVLLITAVGVIAVAARMSQYDWNHMLQHLVACCVWLVLYACCYSLSAGLDHVRLRRSHCLIIVAAVLMAMKAAEAMDSNVLKSLGQSSHESGALAASLLAPPGSADPEFFQYLTANTNLPHSLHVDPVNVDFLKGQLVNTKRQRPNIFIITVDSLRRDYVSPYNSRVTFTPSIGEFAKESFVYSKAFTRYGGTGLSEPSIWAGSLLLHKQYVTPFAPMNILEKLIHAENYRTHISRDTILTTLLLPRREGVDDDLDRTTQNMDYDLNRSLRELQSKLAERISDPRPVFAYTQPQNLHISVLQRDRSSVPQGGSFPGFHAPYASRVKHIDAGFGEFIAYLKRSGIYDNSIVILTADHGDSLGEDGRWGHAYTIYPEIMQIPLIVHLPEALKQNWVTEIEAVTFSADITPTLYSLLDYEPDASRPEFGTSVFRRSGSPAPKVQQGGLQFVASSYGAVYGALAADGSKLFIADGANYSEYCYDLTTPTPTPVVPSPAFVEQARAFIRERIDSVSELYRLKGRS